MGNITGKVWGDTSVIIQNPLVELHKINIKAGYKCSEHKHEHKWNGFYVVSGTLEIHVRKNNYQLTDITTLRAGDFTTVRPGEFHWFSSITDCVALELYYPELLSEDIVRKSVGGLDTSPVTSFEGKKVNPVYENVTLTDVDTGTEYTYPTIKEFEIINSPCVNVCNVDPLTNKCRGCGRTPQQITAYGLKYSNNIPERNDK
jgi:mannose-6-phosphate isomerase-like protein (cupin superfamily)